MDFHQIWLSALSEQRDLADPSVEHIFSANDMPVAHGGIQLRSNDREDAEYYLLACKAASHFHSIDLRDVGGEAGRDLTIEFPSFESCCCHPMLSRLDSRTVKTMRNRCKADTIMTVSFTCNVSPTGGFLVLDEGTRITGTNLEEDRILVVTCKSGRVMKHDTMAEANDVSALHRLMRNSLEDIKRRLAGFRYTRCGNVSRSAILALLKIGEAMVHAVDNLVTAVKSIAPPYETVWSENGAIIKVANLKDIDGYDDKLDSETSIDPLVDLLLSAANREIINARSGCPPPVNLGMEKSCVERRLLEYFKQTLLNTPSKPALYSMRAAVLEALVRVSGLRTTLNSLCTSSLAKEISAQSLEDYYAQMKIEEITGLPRQRLEELSRPLRGTGHDARTRRTASIIDTACRKVRSTRNTTAIIREDILHDPDVLHKDYTNGNMELDLLRISDHVLDICKRIDHDTEVRILNLLAIGAELIRENLQKEGSVFFYGIRVLSHDDDGIRVETENDVRISFVNIRGFNSHSDVFGSMISFMLGGPTEGVVETKNPALCIPDRSNFVRDVYQMLAKNGLSRSQSIETAIIIAKVLAMRRTQEFDCTISVDEEVKELIDRVRNCIVEQETGSFVEDLVHVAEISNMDHYGADSSMLSRMSRNNLDGLGFRLLDYSENRHLYGQLNVKEDAVRFSEEGQRYWAYCLEGRVFVRKRGIMEEPRRRLGGSKFGLTVMGTGGTIELKEKKPWKSDADAMDMIMFRARERSTLGRWIWSKILSGNIYYRQTEDSCMWNRDAASESAGVIGRWSVPKWVLRYMLAMVDDSQNVRRRGQIFRDKILVQAGDEMPVFRLIDNDCTRYNCERVSGTDVHRRRYRKAFFSPDMSCAGANHPKRSLP